jgi:hypothetical protein
MIGLGVSLGEALAAATFAYVFAVASFNAGYFDKVPSRFVELFSFSDLVNSNIPILQYIISVYTTYCVLSILFAVPRHFLSKGIDKLVTAETIPAWSIDLLPFISLILLSIAAIGGSYHYDAVDNKFFTLEFLPWAILFGFIFDFTWTNYRRNEITQRNFLIQIAINAIIFCHISGRMWLKYEIRNPDGIQAIYLQSGDCLDRKLLRASASGYLLYSFDLKQFEFRDKGSIKTIYGIKGCN